MNTFRHLVSYLGLVTGNGRIVFDASRGILRGVEYDSPFGVYLRLDTAWW